MLDLGPRVHQDRRDLDLDERVAIVLVGLWKLLPPQVRAMMRRPVTGEALLPD